MGGHSIASGYQGGMWESRWKEVDFFLFRISDTKHLFKKYTALTAFSDSFVLIPLKLATVSFQLITENDCDVH